MERWWTQAYPDESYRTEVISKWMGLVGKALADKSEIERQEYRVTCKDGTIKTVLIFGIPVYDKIFVIFDDITIKKKSEQQILNFNAELEMRVNERTEELERTNKELEEFCYALSHEFRAPIARLEGFGTILQEIAGEDDKEQIIRCADRIVAAGNRLRTVIDSLLVMNRAFRAEMYLQIINLSDLANHIIFELIEDVSQSSMNISIEPDVIATGDRYMLEICMRNLLSNAVKYSSKKDDALIEFGQSIISGEKVYFVRDNGVGFDMNFSKDIFKPFCRLHTESEFEGTGIGLATVHRIIEKHNGRIWIDAKPGEGATFFFTLGVSGGER
jgi:light-regulated signal transduction histidine kinase (bacteriophytochrome)